MTGERAVDRPEPIVVIVVFLVAVAAFVVVPAVISPPGVESSTYGYSISLSTNVTLSFPRPVSEDGTSPIAESIRARNATAPEPWRYDVVETDHGLVVQVEADELRVERRSDGNRYSTYLFSTNAPSPDVIDAGDPFGVEPTIATTGGRREVPCPNVEAPPSGETCYSFDTRVYAAYDAPADASVDVFLVSNGVNTDEGSGRHDMYYERVTVFLDGPQDGWFVAEGFVSTGADS